MNAWGWHFEWLFSAKMVITIGVLIVFDAFLLYLGNRARRSAPRGH